MKSCLFFYFDIHCITICWKKILITLSIQIFMWWWFILPRSTCYLSTNRWRCFALWSKQFAQTSFFDRNFRKSFFIIQHHQFNFFKINLNVLFDIDLSTDLDFFWMWSVYIFFKNQYLVHNWSSKNFCLFYKILIFSHFSRLYDLFFFIFTNVESPFVFVIA